jgi:hypothetical protein
MMHHPLHLHGHFFRVVNGQGDYSPLKHTVDVAPMQRTIIEFEANEEKDWFFHCHVLYHMVVGMARVFSYEDSIIDEDISVIRKNLTKNHWYLWTDLTLASQFNGGDVFLVDTRNRINLNWEYGNWQGNYSVELKYNRYANRFFQPSVFLSIENEDVERDYLSSISNTPVVGGFIGFHYLLPLNIESAVYVGFDSEQSLMTKIEIEKEFQLLQRLVLFVDFEYNVGYNFLDSQWFFDAWDIHTGFESILTKRLSVIVSYSSQFGYGFDYQNLGIGAGFILKP